MKCFLGHYIFLSGLGFLKKWIVQTDEKGVVVSLFPLNDEEIESVIWLPGVISLVPLESLTMLDCSEGWMQLFNTKTVLDEVPLSFTTSLDAAPLSPVCFFPFDYERMQPSADTQFRQLR